MHPSSSCRLLLHPCAGVEGERGGGTRAAHLDGVLFEMQKVRVGGTQQEGPRVLVGVGVGDLFAAALSATHRKEDLEGLQRAAGGEIMDTELQAPKSLCYIREHCRYQTSVNDLVHYEYTSLSNFNLLFIIQCSTMKKAITSLQNILWLYNISRNSKCLDYTVKEYMFLITYSK